MDKKADQTPYYFSDKLKKQLEQISRHPLTIVEAPSGFGKTTAVREYLKQTLSKNAIVLRYTCLGESASLTWAGICELIKSVNERLANDLKKQKMPTMETLFEMLPYFRDLECENETYFVVDNYQLIHSDIPHELLSVFAMHGNPQLHIILITQQMKAEHPVSIYSSNIFLINSSVFFFDREGIAALFGMEGIHLTDEELEQAYIGTAGWVSAIRLQITRYQASGKLDCAADTEHLVETAIWNGLSREEREFLVSVSILETFTAQQAAIILGEEILPENIRDLLKSNDFIRYIPDQLQYSIHGILRNYLLNRFYEDQSKDAQEQIFRKAGQACAAASQYCLAINFFYKLKDFEAILSLPFSCKYFDEYRDRHLDELIKALIGECPPETLCAYPAVLLVLGYHSFSCGQLDVYQELCRTLRLAIQNTACLHPEEAKRINGEYLLLAALEDFNDLYKMKKRHKAAWELLGKPSDLIKTNSNWGFAFPSVLSMFWRESGKLNYALQQMDELSVIFRKMTQGHGAGAKNVMRAEYMLMRGDDDESEILCYKALYDARNQQQASICLCAEMTLAHIAILRGDVRGYLSALKNIEGYAKDSANRRTQHIAEYCMSAISLLLGMKENVAPWLYDIESIRKTQYAPVVPLAEILHLQILLMEQRYGEFYAVCGLALDKSRNPAGNIRYMMPQIYQLIFLATAKQQEGKQGEAQAYLNEALRIALPDRVYLPFSQSLRQLHTLLEEAESSHGRP